LESCAIIEEEAVRDFVLSGALQVEDQAEFVVDFIGSRHLTQLLLELDDILRPLHRADENPRAVSSTFKDLFNLFGFSG
jgi:hypothetical protein